MTRPRIQSRSPGPFANTLLIRPEKLARNNNNNKKKKKKKKNKNKNKNKNKKNKMKKKRLNE